MHPGIVAVATSDHMETTFQRIRSDEGLALETSAIVSFTAFHYPHQHTVDTPVFTFQRCDRYDR